MEIIDLRSSTTQAKVIGTIVSISGALVAVLYKGPTIPSSQSPKVSYHSLEMSQTNWAIGAITSFIFLGDALHLGSVVGGIILLLGFYAVLRGKAKEQQSMNCGSEILGASTDAQSPLLRRHMEEKYVE
ncbi:WAT1-related protein [Parasponia andersonii]|uniref:WAT1-related protein n=1 Tax=Parasponia andersonii TaxID=3476 RepID=A0A2P5BF73_PARAD|nr:WAT1-related protein [Parasponia andersonii]